MSLFSVPGASVGSPQFLHHLFQFEYGGTRILFQIFFFKHGMTFIAVLLTFEITSLIYGSIRKNQGKRSVSAEEKGNETLPDRLCKRNLYGKNLKKNFCAVY